MAEDWNTLFKKKKHRRKIPNRLVVDLIPLFKKEKFKRILDLGCGTGRHTVYLSKNEFFVVGSDISPRGLKLSQKWIREENIENCCLVKHDMIELPFPNAYFDAVISTNVIHHNTLNKIKKTVSEIRRVLKKNGIVMLTIASTNSYGFGIGKKLEKNTYLTEGHEVESHGVHHFFDKSGIEKILSKFRILDLREIVEDKTVRRKKVKSYHWYVLAKKR